MGNARTESQEVDAEQVIERAIVLQLLDLLGTPNVLVVDEHLRELAQTRDALHLLRTVLERQVYVVELDALCLEQRL